MIKGSKEFLEMFPYDIMPLDSIRSKLKEHSIHLLDVEFPPVQASIYTIREEEPFAQTIVWKRPKEFMVVDESQNLFPPQVFDKKIEPDDIKQGALGDCWFMCALSSLAEMPQLVERLFITQKYNDEGIYRIKICKNGEWMEVTIDDYFPCSPEGGPVFSRSNGNELWVLLLEKAYAKVHGNYFTLRGGFANEGMMDLTGSPTECFDFED
jgi:calpain-15